MAKLLVLLTMLEQIEDLGRLDRSELTAKWVMLFNKPVPRKLSMPMMRRMIAFELQAKVLGGLSPSTRRRLASLGRPGSKTTAKSQMAGSRLVREWNGVTHIVEVQEDGFVWQGKRYRSLSAIARAITSARWSGPRFFGISQRGSNGN